MRGGGGTEGGRARVRCVANKAGLSASCLYYTILQYIMIEYTILQPRLSEPHSAPSVPDSAGADPNSVTEGDESPQHLAPL